MSFGIVLIATAGFLLGGAYSIARLKNEGGGPAQSDPSQRGRRLRPVAQSDPSQRGRRLRPVAQFAVAGGLVLLAGYLIFAGIIQFGRE